MCQSASNHRGTVTAVDRSGVPVTSCPACHGTDLEQVGNGASAFTSEIGGRQFFQPAYAVHACATCGLYCKSPILSPDQLDAYYAVLDGGTFEFDGDFPTDRILRRRLQDLRRGSKVLDFGCSTGRIWKGLTSRLQCFGVEPNAAAAAAARARGIEIIAETTVAGSGQRYDAIVLADVFEHLSDPMPVLRMLADRLAPGGWLAIVTGNADAITHRQRLAEFWYFRIPGHLIMLGERHLAWLSRQLGLAIEVHHCSHYRIGWRDRVRQRVQELAYDAFQTAPSGPAARVLRFVPRLSNAATWTAAPALTYRRDHVVALFSRRQD